VLVVFGLADFLQLVVDEVVPAVVVDQQCDDCETGADPKTANLSGSVLAKLDFLSQC
jgi:hypothetical protein